MTPEWQENLVFIYTNLHLLLMSRPQYCLGETNIQAKVRDKFDALGDGGMLEVANISLEWQMEVVVFTNDGRPEVMLGCLRLQTSHEWQMEVVVFTNDG